MAKNILGGFKGDTNSLITSSAVSIPSGKYSTEEVTKLRYRGSWPVWNSEGGKGIYFSTAGIGSTDFASSYPQSTHAFVICAGGGGSGANDNDCEGQGPGGSGGFGKALVSLSAVGSNVANFTVGSGGGGVQGNDAAGNPGNSSTVTIGNFTITANGGGGGQSKNGGGNAGGSGSCSVNGPNVSFSTSNVFYTPLVGIVTTTTEVSYITVKTNVNGSSGTCGGTPTGNGVTGFVYLRWGAGINALTTLTPGKDPTGTGPDAPYTPVY